MNEINLGLLRLEARVKVMNQFGKCILMQLAHLIPALLLLAVGVVIELRYPMEQMLTENMICWLVLMFVQMLVIVPVMMGQYLCANNLHKHGDFAISDLFAFFESGKKLWFALKYMLLASLKILLWVLPVIILTTILLVIMAMANFNPIVLLLVYYIIILGVSFATVWLQMRYFAGIVFALEMMEGGESQSPLKANQIMKKGMTIMKGRAKEILIFNLNFVGWYLLIIITCGLATFFVMPYYTTATMAYYNMLKNPPEERIKSSQIEN